MITIIVIIGYLIGVVITGRLMYWQFSNEDDREDISVALFTAIFWPVIVGILVAISPFIAICKLIKLPPRSERKKRAENLAEKLAAEHGLPYPFSPPPP